jgi:hypothetical protein
VSLEILGFALVLTGGGPRRKRAKVAALAGAAVLRE